LSWVSKPLNGYNNMIIVYQEGQQIEHSVLQTYNFC